MTNVNAENRNYSLDANGVCYNTRVAANAAILSEDDWLAGIAGSNPAFEDSALVNEFIAQKILLPLSREIDIVLRKLEIDEIWTSTQKNCLRTRWKQMQALVEGALS